MVATDEDPFDGTVLAFRGVEGEAPWRPAITVLSEALAAERISADAAAALRHDLLRARPWWRRWFK